MSLRNVTREEYDGLLQSGWSVRESDRFSSTKTLECRRDPCETFGFTVAYAFTAPFVLATTVVIAAPLCLLGCVAEMAGNTDRAQTDLSERDFLVAQRGASTANQNATSCLESVCSWNTSVLLFFRPCDGTRTMEVRIIS